MAGPGSESKMRLAIVIEKKTERVLFAEAGKDFVDLLCSFLSKPVDKKMKRGETTYKKMFACKAHHHISDFPKTECPTCRMGMRTELYEIDDGNSSSSSSSPEEVAAADTNTRQQVKKLYTCPFLRISSGHCFVSDDRYKLCPVCQGFMRIEMKVVYPEVAKTKTIQGVRYVVMDNLKVKPMPMNIMLSAVDVMRMDREGRHNPKTPIQNMLREIGFCSLGADDVDFKFVNIGTDKVLELLKAMVQEQELTLTNILLRNNK